MYNCPCPPEPGYLAEPYHLPGYSGHVPDMRHRNGSTYGKLTHDVMEDPCVPQAPIPILQLPVRCCPPPPRNNNYSGNNGCAPRNNSGCCETPCCFPMYNNSQSQSSRPQSGQTPGFRPGQTLPYSPHSGNEYTSNIACEDLGCCSGFSCPPPRPPPVRRKPVCEPLPCIPCYDPRAHHLNRGPYACPCKPEADTSIYRCCESLSPTYAGHIPGFTFHSNGRTTGRATWGTKQYMDNCLYYNTFLQ